MKPLFTDLDFRTASDRHKSVGSELKEKVVGAVASILKNDETDQICDEGSIRRQLCRERPGYLGNGFQLTAERICPSHSRRAGRANSARLSGQNSPASE